MPDLVLADSAVRWLNQQDCGANAACVRSWNASCRRREDNILIYGDASVTDQRDSALRGRDRATRRRLPRRSVVESRELMLAAAVNLLTESTLDSSEASLAAAAAHVRVTDVVAEATRLAVAAVGGRAEYYVPMTIGALYQIWPTQPDFQADLVLHVAKLESAVVPHPAGIAELVAVGTPSDEIVHRTLTAAVAHMRRDPLTLIQMGFYAHVGNPNVRSALAAGYQTFHDQVIPAWSELLAACQRRIRPPYTIDDLATTIAAVIEGFNQRWFVDPERLRDPFGVPTWDLATRTIETLIAAMTDTDV